MITGYASTWNRLRQGPDLLCSTGILYISFLEPEPETQLSLRLDDFLTAFPMTLGKNQWFVHS